MGFVAAVVHKPKILILDEAFSGLDPVNVEPAEGYRQRDAGSGNEHSVLYAPHGAC